MNTPLITVIVPVYNIKEYLPRCVASLTAQTYHNMEILLVDDGSTDGTGALCDEIAAGDDRIRVFHKENGGSSSARNLALKEARGEYLGFVDSDDYVDDTMYERLYQGIVTYGVKVAQIGRDEIHQDGYKLPDICEPPLEDTLIPHREFLKELLMHRGDCSFCTKLFHRSILEGEQFPLGVLNEDFHLLVSLLERIDTIISLPGQTYHVFCREGSNTRKKAGFSRVFADNIDNADMVEAMVSEKKDEELVTIAFRFAIFQRIDYMLHIPIEEMRLDNTFYRSVVRYLRKNWWRGMRNPILTMKNKCYHTLFAVAPKVVRVLHRFTLSLRK